MADAKVVVPSLIQQLHDLTADVVKISGGLHVMPTDHMVVAVHQLVTAALQRISE